MKRLILLLIIIIKLKVNAEELTYSINNRKSISKLNDRFISFSIDPAVLISALNISDVTYKLARHLGPSFLRIAGPTTDFLEFSTTEENVESNAAANNSQIFISPKMFGQLHDGLLKSNITAVFVLNDKNRIKKAWNPKSAFKILDLSDKMNMSCFWQLGYECSNITESQYKEDLMALRHIMDAFPRSRENWGIIGNDLNACSFAQNAETMKKQLNAMENVVDAIAFRPKTDNFATLSFSSKSRTIPWVIAPSPDAQISFKSSILWAKQLGDAAVSGFEVVFRQPRMRELFYDTPAFWVSLLHKKFMGRNVLEVKAANPYKNTYVYAHCAKRQNSFSRRGAMTVFAINDSPLEQTVALKIGLNPQYQNLEVQSYVLTSPYEGSKETYLNGIKLSMEDLREDTVEFTPRHRRALLNRNKHLTVSMPPKSIGFFVLPGTRVPACIEREDETDLLMKEMFQEQNNNFLLDEAAPGDYTETSSTDTQPITTLLEVYQMMQQELQSDEKLYGGKKVTDIPSSQDNEWPGMLMERAKGQELGSGGNLAVKKPLKTAQDAKLYIMERAKELKAAERGLKMQDRHGLKKLLLDRAIKNTLKQNTNKEPKPLEFELSSQEIRTILHDRARARATEKNIKITSEEIDHLMKQAADKLLTTQQQNEKNKSRTATAALAKLPKFLTPRQKRSFRKPKSNFLNNEVKKATLYNPAEVEEDIIQQETDEEDAEDIPPKDVYAGLYRPPPEDYIIRQQDIEPETPRPLFRKMPWPNFPKLQLPREIEILIPDVFRFKRQHAIRQQQQQQQQSQLMSKPVRAARVKEDFVIEVPNDKNESFDVNADDDLKNYHMFHEMVSTSPKVQPQKVMTFQEDIWGFPIVAELEEKTGVAKEKRMSTMEEQMTIQRTKEHLENYFNKEENFQGNEGPRKPIMNINDYYLSKTDKGHAQNSQQQQRTNKSQSRRRRAVGSAPLTSLLKEQEAETKLTSLNRLEPEPPSFFAMERIHMQVGKPYNASEIRIINQRERKIQENYLKKRLEARKKWNSLLGKDKSKLFAESRRKRFVLLKKSQAAARKAQRGTRKDKNRNVLYENRNHLRLDVSNHLDGGRRKREAPLQTIDDSVNEIKKERDPSLGLSGPNKDVFDVVANGRNDIQINFQHDVNFANGSDRSDVAASERRFPNSTNFIWKDTNEANDSHDDDDGDLVIPSNFSVSTADLPLNITNFDQLFNDGTDSYESDTVFFTSYDDLFENATTVAPGNGPRNASLMHVQKIAPQDSEGNFLRKIFDGVSYFFDKVHSKITGFYNYFNR